VVPLPPPWAGVEQVSRVLLASPLRERFDLAVIKSNVRDSNADKGRWDLSGIVRVLRTGVLLGLRLLFRRPAVVYLTLSQNTAGLARDLLYLRICRCFRVPAVAHLHGSLLAEFLSRQSPARRAFFQRGISSARFIVVCGESIAQTLRPIFGDRVVAVANATPPDAFVSRQPRAPTNAVAYMAHLSRAKGFYDLLSAAERVWEQRPDTRFVFAGERLDVERNVGDAGSASDTWARFETMKNRHADRIEWRGIVTGEAKHAFFQSADVFALPSYAEAFPMSILEAMAAGLPTVATAVGAVPDVVRPGVNGFLLKPGDVGGLAQSLLTVLKDAAQRERLSAGAVGTAQEFSVERQAAAIGDLLERAARS
jgi:glycosyltransferase involved in cell wall biosynthesis